MTIPADRERCWPYLATEGYKKTSEETFDYNCIAFAADDEELWWWPDAFEVGHWPIAKREVTLACFIEAYKTERYQPCADGSLEEGYEKIVIYMLNNEPTHAAKQLPNGHWKSKLGPWEDIEHNTVKAVEEYIYGKATQYMKREKIDAV